MLLRKTAENPQLLLRVGLLFLVLANLAQYLVPRLANLPENVADGGMGLLYGLAFGLLLLSLRRGRADASNG